jgi:ethanolaminephosphotransferase
MSDIANFSPNLITLSGFGFVVVNFLTLLWYSPTLDQNMPPWVYYTFSICLFLYQTFDAVDGTQARRTRQSGPLGELFDHGVDAINTVLEVLIFSAAMNMGQSWLTVLTLCSSLGTFYLTTWEEYYTHTLYLGLVSGPVEGIFMLCIVYAFTGYMGGGWFWEQPALPMILPASFAAHIPEVVWNAPLNLVNLIYGGVILGYNVKTSCENVAKHCRKNGTSATSAYLGLLPFVATYILAFSYLGLNPLILREHLVPYAFFLGLVNAFSVGRMITAHLVKSRFPYRNPLFVPLAFGVLDSIGPAMSYLTLDTTTGISRIGWPSCLGVGSQYQVAYVFLSLGVGIGVYGMFVVDVIVTICDYLDIWCLTIKHPYVEPKESAEAKSGKSVEGKKEL